MDETTGFPPLYAPWVTDLLAGAIPAESKATCENCAMCRGSDDVAPGMFFDPVVRCCTYEPAIPNYLVGRILEDHDPGLAAGRASVEARIDARIAVTPWGLDQSSRFRVLYEHARGTFGRAPGLRCPHYVDSAAGTCGIWRHRPGVCATWFCKHERGQVSLRFWQRLAHLLREMERELGLWCVAELGAESVDVTHVSGAPGGLAPADLDGEFDEEAYRRLWGRWQTKERTFFVECARLVEPLTWADVLSICGPRVGILSRLARDAYGRVASDAIPDRLTVGSLQIAGFLEGKFRVQSYSEYDPLLMPAALAALLPYFDGRPTVDALDAIRAEKRIKIDLALVRRMVDFGVLVGVNENGT